MDNREAVALCRTAGSVFAEVAATVEGVHLGVLSRVRAGTRSPVVDGVERQTAFVYRVVKGAGAAASAVCAVTAGTLLADQRPSLAQTPRGAARLAALQAAIGDQLHDDPRTRALSTPLSFRESGRVVPPAAIAAECEARRALGVAVLLHGLAGTEYQWGSSYTDRLAEHDLLVARVRYNAGRAIMSNGAELASLLDELVAALPQERRRLVLVGHSMGGLVIGSALAQSDPAAAWVGAVSDVVTLGTPHGGAALEKAAAVALTGLQQFRESGPIAVLGNKRAQGIKDLRFGALLPEHWDGRHPDEVLQAAFPRVELPSGVRQHMVVASLGQPGSLLGRLVGDGLVRHSSAVGGGRIVHVLHATGHMRLLDDPRVADILAEVAAAPVP